MNFEQICKRADSESGYLKDKDCSKIFIASSADNPFAPALLDIFRANIVEKGVKAKALPAGSFGYYDLEPLILIEKPGHLAVLYKNADARTVPDLVNDYLVNDNPREDIAFCTLGSESYGSIQTANDILVLNIQKRIALRNCGLINPEDITHYILRGKGYSGLFKALQMKSTGVVIEEIRKSGLRGSGGAGYFTADKWEACSEAKDEEKYVICNAIDSDPKSRSSSLLLESDPHSVLEGLLIAAYATGSTSCIVCVNAVNLNLIKRLKIALEQMRDYTLLSTNILNSDFSCDITIKEIKPALVYGQETALLRLLKGMQAMPYMRPPYPAVKGFSDKPTLINNIETLSNVSAVFQHGTEVVSGTGTEKSKGSKIVTLYGKIVHEYTLEVPFGTTFQNITDAAGNGLADNTELKAMQFGGPTGAYFGPGSFDTVIDYEAAKEADFVIGSGTLELFGGDLCAVDMARDAMSYLHSESCGKCVFCREGTLQISDMLEDIRNNNGRPQDIDLIKEIGEQMPAGCICGLGRTAANPALSSIKLFREDYDAHIKEKRCVKI